MLRACSCPTPLTRPTAEIPAALTTNSLRFMTRAPPRATNGPQFLLAEDADLDVLLVDIDCKILELIDQFFEVFGFDLREIDVQPLVAHCLIDMHLRRRRNQAGQAYSSAKQ